MDLTKITKNRNLFYILLFLTALGVGAIFFVNRYFYLFADKNDKASSGEDFDVASVNIKKLDMSILETNKFQSLNNLGTTAVNTNDLGKGKRNPFLPN